MEYDKKTLKIAAKITAGTLSERGEFGEENAKKTVAFLKTAYKFDSDILITSAINFVVPSRI